MFYLASLELSGLISNNIPNFAPAVSSGYTITPSNSRIRLTSSGELVTDELGLEDSGTYTFSSPDHGGATLTISVTISSECISIFHFFIIFLLLVPTPTGTIEGLFGEKIVIPCGNIVRAMRYEWWKDGVRIPSENTSSLVLLNASYDHVGFYHCFAFHSNSVAFSKTQLNIQGQNKAQTGI